MPQGVEERMDGRTENLPILQDFVPYRGRCPNNRISLWYHKSLGPKKSKIATHDATIHYCLKEARQKYHEPKLAKLFAGAGLGAERARASTFAGLWVWILVHSADYTAKRI